MESNITHPADAATATAVQGLYKDLINSWNQYSAAGFSELFMDDGSLVGFDGSQVNGRQAIHDHLQGIFADHRPATFVFIIREVRAIAPTVAMLRAVVSMVPPDGSDIMPEVNAIQTMLAVKEAGQYYIAMFQNTPAVFHGQPEAAAELTAELRAALKD
jgi:uncharacterized protein (TIGR02246 family)